MKKLLLAIPLTIIIQDLITLEGQEPKLQDLSFDVVFKPITKKQSKKITPKELTQLFTESKQIISDGVEGLTDDQLEWRRDRAETISLKIIELKDEVLTNAFNVQVSGKDADTLLVFAMENECMDSVIGLLKSEYQEVKKKQS